MKRFLLIVGSLWLLAGCGGGGGGGASSSPASGSVLPAALRAAPTSITASGVIAGMISGGFTLNTESGAGYVDVFTSSSTVISGPAPAVGEGATVNGNGSYSTSINATSITTTAATATSPGGVVTAPTAGPSTAPIATPQLLSSQGTASNITSAKFLLEQGYPHGNIWVTKSASTLVIGSFTSGSYVQILGTGSLSSGMSASVVAAWPSVPSSVTVSGIVAAAQTYGFTLSSNGTSVPIIMSTSTIVGGGTLTVGANVKVSGIGSTSQNIAASAIVVSAPTPPPGTQTVATPGPISQTHILTADYLGAPDGSGTVTPAQAAKYVSWAQTVASNANNVAAAGIKVQVYADPNRTQAGDAMHTSDLSTYAQTCGGTQVTDRYNNSVTQYVMNPASASMQALFNSSMRQELSGVHADALFVDDAGPLSEFTSTPFSPGMPCNYTDQSWIAGEVALNNSAPVPVIFNGLSALNGESPSLSLGLLAGSNTMGGNFEHCYSDSSDAKEGGWLWTAVENTELQVAAANKMFECMALNTASASSSTDARTYALASFLLTYNPSTSMLLEAFATTSGLHALPETQLVPLDPTTAAPANVASLSQIGGAYGRQYQECFLAGQFVGACAVIVNPNESASVPNPYPQYSHTLVMSGSDALDGGSVATNGPAAPSTISPLGSAIVFP